MPPSPKPHPTRYAIQKARGKGWKTLEVGEELDHARARFALMVKVNPRAYFRLIELNHRGGTALDGMEFDWTLIELHDPNAKGGPRGKPAKPVRATRPSGPARRTGRKPGDRVPLPLRFYLAVVLIGALAGVLLALRYGLPGS